MPRKHVVKDGEYLTLIARKHHFVTPRAIHEANQDLWQRRDPDVLNPGDELVIPDKRVKTVPRATERVHTFQLVQPEDRLRVVLEDRDDRPLDDQPFTLRVQAALDAPEGSGLEITGRVTGGHIDVRLPPGSRKARLTLDETPGVAWDLLIGYLDPAHEPVTMEDQPEQEEPEDPSDRTRIIVKGVQARLNNMGFHCGRVDGVIGPRTRAAIARFQREKMGRDEPTGKLDGETRKRLKDKHEA
jgi:hypothetical protein